MMLMWNPKIAKVEFGDNFAIISNELKNGDPFMSFFATSLCIGASKPSKMNAWTLGFEGEYDFSKYLVLWSAWLSRYKCFIYVVDRFWGSICIFTPCGNIKNSNAPMCYKKRWIKVQYMVLKINGGLIIVVEEKLANN